MLLIFICLYIVKIVIPVILYVTEMYSVTGPCRYVLQVMLTAHPDHCFSQTPQRVSLCPISQLYALIIFRPSNWFALQSLAPTDLRTPKGFTKNFLVWAVKRLMLLLIEVVGSLEENEPGGWGCPELEAPARLPIFRPGSAVKRVRDVMLWLQCCSTASCWSAPNHLHLTR